MKGERHKAKGERHKAKGERHKAKGERRKAQGIGRKARRGWETGKRESLEAGKLGSCEAEKRTEG
jgi:hypothetical protein